MRPNLKRSEATRKRSEPASLEGRKELVEVWCVEDEGFDRWAWLPGPLDPGRAGMPRVVAAAWMLALKDMFQQGKNGGC